MKLSTNAKELVKLVFIALLHCRYRSEPLSGHSEGRETIIVCCELFVAGRCPETVENMAFGYLSFQRIVQTFFIFELLIYPRVISIIKGIVIAHNLTYVILNNDKAIEI